MNTETGALYEGLAAIQAAEQRGEPVVRISERAAAIVKLGNQKKKRARKMAKQSRKRNR